MALLLAAGYAVFLWWFTTGLILWLDGRPAHTWPRSMLRVTLLGVASLAALSATADRDSVAAAYCAFTCAVLVWGWIEVSFLLGYVTGTHKVAAPAEASESQRFGLAVRAIIWHELFIVLVGAAVIALTWGGVNQTGTWTFMVLWVMRLSAKLNLFLGVRNRGEDFLPPKMRYLGSFFGRRPVNLLFPVVVTAASAYAALLWMQAVLPGTSDVHAVSLALVAALLSLAIFEHWLMVLPLQTTALWRWAMANHRAATRARDGAGDSDAADTDVSPGHSRGTSSTTSHAGEAGRSTRKVAGGATLSGPAARAGYRALAPAPAAAVPNAAGVQR
jgi:putative photosynthetic complex assembly protein 2